MGSTNLVRFSKGEILFKEGDTDRHMFIIRSGKVGIYKMGDNKLVLVTVLEQGSFVGEMSFVSGLTRSASARAEEDVIASRIDTDMLGEDSLGLNGWIVNIARVIANRIRRTTDLFVGEYSPESGADPLQHGSIKEDKDLVLTPYQDKARGSIFLKGSLQKKHLDELKEYIRNLSIKGCSEVILDFSEVPDIDNGVIDFLSALTLKHVLFQNTNVMVKNVQLIRSKLLSIKGIRQLIAETRLPTKQISQGDYLIRQGEEDQVMYVVKTGSFTIFREVEGQEITLGKAEADDVVGEMKLVAGGVRSASVRAEKASVVYRIEISEFYKNSYQIPSWFMDLIRSLVVRLRKTNDMLERAVRRQTREEEEDLPAGLKATPIGILLDSSSPGKIILQGHFVKGNREYLSTMVNLFLKRGIIDITLDMKQVEMLDQESIRYLLKLYVYLNKKGGVLQILGPQKDILFLFKQYDIEL
ncbi:MAG: cyclic nucleotide-binding domain-containing protein [Spirochaetaceae bacterium]|jgi:CRP-like cAMP-binding protein/anti-anti-sigma regulatory factor|nr:cyclic nucleotide-binding domain-containing protein [Spirochaetaceae bacterium]